MNPLPKIPEPSPNPNPNLHQFALLTPHLLILPTPIAITIPSYRTLYAALHADKSFCQMGFGDHFPVRNWSDDDTRHVIQSRDIEKSWMRRGLGDFAVGLRSSVEGIDIPDHEGIDSGVVIEGTEFEHLINPQTLENIKWVGYAGVRDATTTSLQPLLHETTSFPPWDEMIELRYGISPLFWGSGFAMEASRAVMQWAVAKRGVKRFIAETEIENQRSARVLEKLGFVRSGTDYFKEPVEIEWEWIVR